MSPESSQPSRKTAAVAAGTLLAATRVTGTALRDQTFVLFGAGTAGCGIGHLLLKLMIAEGVSERGLSGAVARVEVYGAVERRLGFKVPPLAAEDLAQIEVRFGITGIDSNRFVKLLYGRAAVARGANLAMAWACAP